MSILEDLRGMLTAYQLNNDYSDETLESFILESKLLVGEGFMFDSVEEDYVPDFYDDVYMTDMYPVKDVTIYLGDEQVTPKRVGSEGIIYLPKRVHGDLTVHYTVGLPDDDVTTYLLPICLQLIKQKEGQNLASISEGDVSISYDTGNSSQALVNQLKNKYTGRVVFI